MGRTKLRGVECAGVELAIEVPSNWNWDWADAPWAGSSVLPHEPDVFIGVRVTAPEGPERESVRYTARGVHFEVGSTREDWVVAVYGPRGLERSARFDADFRQGEIRVAPDAIRDLAHPLAHPLDELILFHRLVREGCLVVDARMRAESGEAQLFFDTPQTPNTPSIPGFAVRSRGSTLVLRPAVERSTGGETGVWVYTAPWQSAGEGPAPLPSRSRLAEIHLLAGEDDSDLPSCHSRELSPRAASNELLRHVHAPMHDGDALARLAEVVERVVRQVRVSRLDAPAMSESFVLDWDAPGAALGFSAPAA